MNVQGAPAPDQGAPTPPAEDKEIEGEVYEVIDNEHDANGTVEGEVKGAPRYNLRRQQPPTFASYNNPNGR